MPEFTYTYLLVILAGLFIGLLALIIKKLLIRTAQKSTLVTKLTGLELAEKILTINKLAIPVELQNTIPNEVFDKENYKLIIPYIWAHGRSVYGLAMIAKAIHQAEMYSHSNSLSYARSKYGIFWGISLSNLLGYLCVILGLVFAQNLLAWAGLFLVLLALLLAFLATLAELDANKKLLIAFRKNKLIFQKDSQPFASAMTVSSLEPLILLISSLYELLLFLVR